jgi:hypothetical protein
MCWGSGFYRLNFNKKPKGRKEILESLWESFKLVWVFPVQFVKENILGIWE